MIYSRFARLAALHGLEDWVSAREVGGFVASQGFSDQAVQRDLAVLVIRELLAEGLADVGEIGSEGFESWQATPEVILSRVESDVLEHPGSDWGMDIWIKNTPAGDEVGKAARKSLDPKLWSWDLAD